jgi:hypothetical protein
MHYTHREHSMLSDSTVAYISVLPFRNDARRCVSWLPLCGVYWADEIPDLLTFGRLPESSRLEILRLFAIRYAIWKNEQRSPEDQAFWDIARKQAPQYAFFQRIEVTPDTIDLQNQIQEQYDAAFEELTSHASQVTVTQKTPHVESVSLAFDLAREAPAKLPWWKRIRH